MKKLSFVLVVLLIPVSPIVLSGCATYRSQALVYQEEQLNLLMQEAESKKQDYNKRLNEIEEAYKNQKITEGEYLSLKNNLKTEWNNYHIYAQQRIDYISQRTRNLIYK